METEHYFSGYCRALDGSRMVEVVSQDGQVTEVDCGYGHCAFEAGCPIAARIGELDQK